MLYYYQTTLIFDNIFQAISKLALISTSRIIGRLSLPSFMYVHYFPNVESYYGISNIGMLANILGNPVYENSKAVYTYFTNGREDGSVAIASIFDFYGAFGWKGLFLGSCSLGLVFSFLNKIIHSLERNISTILITIFSFITVYYLSQASVAKSLMSYGGVFFVGIWLATLQNFKILIRKRDSS